MSTSYDGVYFGLAIASGIIFLCYLCYLFWYFVCNTAQKFKNQTTIINLEELSMEQNPSR